MTATPRTNRPKRARLRVGDRVRFHFADRWLVGTIIEDRGLLAPGRKRVLRVRVRRSQGDDLITEMPADELRAA
jgi:hypothetical protein